MDPSDLQRKLAAIMSADVKGYSLLMGDDEVATVRTLTSFRGIIGELVESHHGRVVDSPGDNLLAEFASAVDAVECSARIQERLARENSRLPDHRRMEFRIGINVGDVIVEEGRLYGDGVNIAARLEGLADGGGICISGTVFDQIETKLNYGFVHLGPMKVKNISRPVRGYKVVLNPDQVPPSPESGGFDRAGERGEAGRDPGRLRSEEYHRGFREGLELLKKKLGQSVSGSSQDLPRKILKTVEGVFEKEEEPPAEVLQKAKAAVAEMTGQANQRARRYYLKALQSAPGWVEPRIGLGWTYLAEWLWGWSQDSGVLELTAECAHKALEAEPGSVEARLLLGWAHLWRKQYVPALAAGTKVLDQAPADPDGAAFTAFALTVTGLSEKAQGLVETARRGRPRNPLLHSFSLGTVLYHLRRYEEALAHLGKSLELSPDFSGARLIRALVFSEQGQKDLAGQEIRAILASNPGFSRNLVKKRYPFKDPADLNRFLKALGRAGLK